MIRRITVILAGLLLAACDPTETVYLEHPGGDALLCPEGAETGFDYLFPVVDPAEPDEILYEQRGRATVDASGNLFSTDPDRVGIGILRGSIEDDRVPRIGFTLTRGDDAAPWLVAPKITPEDLEKVERAFRRVRGIGGTRKGIETSIVSPEQA